MEHYGCIHVCVYLVVLIYAPAVSFSSILLSQTVVKLRNEQIHVCFLSLGGSWMTKTSIFYSHCGSSFSCNSQFSLYLKNK